MPSQMNSLLEKLAALPGAQQLIDQVRLDENGKAAAARAAHLVLLTSLEGEFAKAEADHEKVHAAFDAAQAAFIESTGRLSAADQRRNAVLGRLNACRRELRVEHGEQAALDAERRLDLLVARLPAQIRQLEDAIESPPRRGARQPEQEALDKLRVRVEGLRQQLIAARHGLAVVRQEILGKPLAPGEIAIRCAELLETAGI